MNNVFSGDNSILEYLNPANHTTPLVELPSKLNPFADKSVRIFVKLQSMTPLLNIKQIPAFEMLSNANKKATNIIESSSGNMALSLSVIAKAKGYKQTKVIVSNKASLEKINLLKVLGVNIQVNKEPMCPDKDDPNSSINIAKNIALDTDWLNLGQYDNLDNPNGHFKVTGPQIWSQTNGDITVFASTLGTTGTITGTSQFLKSQNKNIKVIGVASADDILRIGPRSTNALKEIHFKWQQNVDYIEEVSHVDSFKASLELVRNGILVGPSTGHNYQGLISFLNKLSHKELEALKNKNGEVLCVFIAADTFFPYINEYLKYLPESNFPKVENIEFIHEYQTIQSQIQGQNYNKYKITVKDFYNKYVKPSYSKQKQINTSEDTLVIDIRSKKDFDNFHIQGIKKFHHHDLEDATSPVIKQLSNYKRIIILDCGLTDHSKLACLVLRKLSIDAYWVEGGMDSYSKMSYPYIDNRIFLRK